jgi:membrane protease subunit HflK
VLLIVAFSSFYVIEEQEQAVITTFGRASTVTTPGIHFKAPFVQKVAIVPMIIKSFSIGYVEAGQADSYTSNIGYREFDDQMVSPDGSVTSESMMITSDYNFVNVDFFLEYQVLGPERYLFASAQPEFILRNLALSYIRDTIGLHGVDEVITTGKNEIQAEIKEKLTNRLEEENIGIQLINITIQDAEPPTTEVKDSFKNVETAKQGKETSINNARKYQSEQIPAARAQEDAILREAEAQKETRINDARAQVAVFNAMYEEYRKNPLMTKQRMFYEAMEEVLPRMRVYIDNGEGTVNKLLPLENFGGAGNTGNTGNTGNAGNTGNTGNTGNAGGN